MYLNLQVSHFSFNSLPYSGWVLGGCERAATTVILLAQVKPQQMSSRKTQHMTSITLAAASQGGHVCRNAAAEPPLTPWEHQRHQYTRFFLSPQEHNNAWCPAEKNQAERRHTSVLCWWKARNTPSVPLKYFKGKIILHRNSLLLNKWIKGSNEYTKLQI